MLEALASDAYTTQYLVSKVKTDANWVAQALTYAKQSNSKSEKKYKAAVKEYSDGSHYYSVTSLTSTYKTIQPATEYTKVPALTFYTGTFSVPWRHYWLIANMAGDPVKMVTKSANVPYLDSTYKFRYKDNKDVWSEMRTMATSAKNYLKEFDYIIYTLWRVDRYNLNRGRKEMYNSTKNLKSVKVEKPFKSYNLPDN